MLLSPNQTKKLADIPSQLMEKDQSIALKLKEEPYLILIPKSLIQTQGITADNLTFDLVKNRDGSISLLGKDIPSKRVIRSTIVGVESLGNKS